MASTETIRTQAGRDVLRSELAKRIARNPHYSLRSFSRTLDVSHSLLSLVLSGKRRPSAQLIAKIQAKLNLGTEQASALTAGEISNDSEIHAISLETFELLSNWYHYGILSLLEIKGAKLDSRWISKRLGISEAEALVAISRLKRLKLIEKKKSGKWKQSTASLSVDNEVSTKATRYHHTQLLKKAEESLERDPFEKRDFSGTTFAMNPKLVPYARKKIIDFRRQLVAELEKMAEPTTVYELSVQIFPLSRGVEE